MVRKLQNLQDGLYIQGIEGAIFRQSLGLVSNLFGHN